MSKTLILAAVAVTLSAGAASAQGANYMYPYSGYAPYGYGYAPTAPLYDYVAPSYGYAAPVYGYAAPVYGYAAPVYGYAAPVYGYAAPKRVQTGQQLPQQPQW